MVKEKVQQYGLVAVGIMVAIGFSGVFSYSGLVNTGSGPESQEINATLPEQNYASESFGLSIQQQAYLAVSEQVVFVNALYENSTQQYSGLESLPEEMNNRVYVNLVNSSESALATGYQLDIPTVLIVGDQPTRTQRGVRPYSLATAEPNNSAVKQAICSVMRSPGELAAACFS